MPLKPVYKSDDVLLVLFPHSDLCTAMLRPALVVQADNFQTGLPQVIVAMITRRLFRANHLSRVTVLRPSPEGQQASLLTDNLATIAESEMDRVIRILPMVNIDKALHQTLRL
jgi:mRNA interferase MazF